MNSILDRDKILVREHVGIFKAANVYDLLDPSSGKVLGRAEEQVSGWWRKLLRFTDFKTMLPFRIHFYDASHGDARILEISRPFTFLRSVVSVHSADGHKLGTFQRKLATIGPKMWVFNARGEQIGMLKGDWKGWNLNVVDAQEKTLATVTKKWAGIGREFFTSADNYVIDIADHVTDPALRCLLFSAAITADMVYKEYA